MPRPKPKTAETSISVPTCLLDDSIKEKLLNLLGANSSRAIVGVEKALSLGQYGVIHMNDIPRPTDYVAVFGPIEKQAMRLECTLRDLGGFYTKQFDDRKADIAAIQKALNTLAKVASSIVSDFKSQSSKGAPSNEVLFEVIRRLRRTFHSYYKGPRTARKTKGAFEYRSEMEDIEIEFLSTALLAGKLIPKSTALNKVKRLILDTRCGIPQLRSQTIEHIARRVPREK